MIINTPLQINIIAKMTASLKENVTKLRKRFINRQSFGKKIINGLISLFATDPLKEKLGIVNMWIKAKK